MCKLNEFLQSEHICADSTWMEKVNMTYSSKAPYPIGIPSCHCAPAPSRAVMRLTPNSTDSLCLAFHTLFRCNPQVLHLCLASFTQHHVWEIWVPGNFETPSSILVYSFGE